MDNTFRRDEKLFRAVLPRSMFWKEDGSAASSAFKTSEEDGLSTDRDGGRPCAECVRALAESRKGSIVSVDYAHCQETEAYVVYDPITGEGENIYHTLIRRSVEKSTLSNKQAKDLAKACTIHLRREFE